LALFNGYNHIAGNWPPPSGLNLLSRDILASEPLGEGVIFLACTQQQKCALVDEQRASNRKMKSTLYIRANK
jgi:hypothetical protein